MTSATATTQNPRPDPGRGTGWVVAQSVLMSALLASGPWRSGDGYHPASIAAGAVLFLVAGAVGVTGVVQLGRNRTPFPLPRPDSQLVRHGIYSRCRHPLYTSVMLAGFAWALLWQSQAALALALLQIPFFLGKSRHEEHLLRLKFPAYESYARQVKRFLPGVY